MTKAASDSFCDRVLLGLREARAAAVEKARQTNTLLVVWQDGKIAEITPDEFEKADQEK